MVNVTIEDDTGADTCSNRRVEHDAIAVPCTPLAFRQRRGIGIIVDFYGGVGIKAANFIRQRVIVPCRQIWGVYNDSSGGIQWTGRADADGWGMSHTRRFQEIVDRGAHGCQSTGSVIGDHGGAALCVNLPGAIDQACRDFRSPNIDAHDHVVLHLRRCPRLRRTFTGRPPWHIKTTEYYTTISILGDRDALAGATCGGAVTCAGVTVCRKLS